MKDAIDLIIKNEDKNSLNFSQHLNNFRKIFERDELSLEQNQSQEKIKIIKENNEYFTEDTLNALGAFYFFDIKYNNKIIPFYFGSKIKENNLLDFYLKKEETDDEIVYHCGFDKIVFNKKTNLYSSFLNGKNTTPYFFLDKVKKKLSIFDKEKVSKDLKDLKDLKEKEVKCLQNNNKDNELKDLEELKNLNEDVINFKDLFHFKTNTYSPTLNTNVLNFLLKEKTNFVSNHKTYLKNIFPEREEDALAYISKINKITYCFQNYLFLKELFLSKYVENDKYSNVFLYLLSTIFAKENTSNFGYYDFLNTFIENAFLKYDDKTKTLSFKKISDYSYLNGNGRVIFSPPIKQTENQNNLYNELSAKIKNILGENDYNNLFLKIKKSFFQSYKKDGDKVFEDLKEKMDVYHINSPEEYFSLFVFSILFSEFYFLNLPVVFNEVEKIAEINREDKDELFLKNETIFQKIDDEYQDQEQDQDFIYPNQNLEKNKNSKVLVSDLNTFNTNDNENYFLNNNKKINANKTINRFFDAVFKNKNNLMRSCNHFGDLKYKLSNNIDYLSMMDVYFFENNQFNNEYRKEVIFQLFDFFEKLFLTKKDISPIEFFNSNFISGVNFYLHLLGNRYYKKFNNFSDFLNNHLEEDAISDDFKEKLIFLKNNPILSHCFKKQSNLHIIQRNKTYFQNLRKDILSSVDLNNIIEINKRTTFHVLKNSFSHDFWYLFFGHYQFNNKEEYFIQIIEMVYKLNNELSKIPSNALFYPRKNKNTEVSRLKHNSNFNALDDFYDNFNEFNFNYAENLKTLNKILNLMPKINFKSEFSFEFYNPFLNRKRKHVINPYSYLGKSFKENLTIGFLRNMIKGNRWLPVLNKITENFYVNDIAIDKKDLLCFIAFNNFIEKQPLLKNLIKDNLQHYSQYPLFFNNDFVYDRTTKKITVKYSDKEQGLEFGDVLSGQDFKEFSSFKLKEGNRHSFGKIVLDKSTQKMLNKHPFLTELNNGFRQILDVIESECNEPERRTLNRNLNFLSDNIINTKYGILNNVLYLPYNVIKNHHLFENEIDKVLNQKHFDLFNNDLKTVFDNRIRKQAQKQEICNNKIIESKQAKNVKQFLKEYLTQDEYNSFGESVVFNSLNYLDKINNVNEDKKTYNNLSIQECFSDLMTKLSFQFFSFKPLKRNKRDFDLKSCFNDNMKTDFYQFALFNKDYVRMFLKRMLVQIDLNTLREDEIVAIAENFIKNYLCFCKTTQFFYFLNNHLHFEKIFYKNGYFNIDSKRMLLSPLSKIHVFKNLDEIEKEDKRKKKQEEKSFENKKNGIVDGYDKTKNKVNVTFEQFYDINQSHKRYYKSFLKNLLYFVYQKITLIYALSMENHHFSKNLTINFGIKTNEEYKNIDDNYLNLKELVLSLDGLIYHVEKMSKYYDKFSILLDYFKQIDFYQKQNQNEAQYLLTFFKQNKDEFQEKLQDLILSFIPKLSGKSLKTQIDKIHSDLLLIDNCFENLNSENVLLIKDKLVLYLDNAFNFINNYKYEEIRNRCQSFVLSLKRLKFHYNHQENEVILDDLNFKIDDFYDVFLLASQRNVIQKDDNLFRILTISEQLHDEVNNRILETDSKYERYVDLVFFKDENFIAYQPYAYKEFSVETKNLNHCIHTYYWDSKDGKYLPFFIRKMKDEFKDKYDKDNFNYLALDKSEYENCATLGYNMNIDKNQKTTIKFDQYRSYNNHNVDDDFLEFKDKLEKELMKVIREHNKKI